MSDVKYHSTRERDAITYNVNEPLSQRYFINAYHLGFKREDISAIGGELPAIGSIKANRFDGRRLKNHTFGIEPVRSMMEPEDEAYDIHLTKHHGEFEHTHPTALSASEKLIYDKRLEWIYAVSDIRNRQSESEHWRNTPTGKQANRQTSKQVNRPIIEEIDL
jgi:hypothetical protein